MSQNPDIPIARRAQTSIDYRSKGYVDDAMSFARWILDLKAADETTRAKMLKELDETVLP